MLLMFQLALKFKKNKKLLLSSMVKGSVYYWRFFTPFEISRHCR